MYFSGFQKKVFEIERKVRELGYLNKLPFVPPEFSFKYIDLPEFPKNLIKNVTVDEQSQDVILYTFSNQSYSASNKTLVVAYYYTSYQTYDVSSRSTIDKYRPIKYKFHPISPGILC